MIATTDVTAIALDKTICQEDLAEVFKIVAEKIQSGEIKDYAIVTEKGSNSHILYDVAERHAMKPVAVLANGRVSQLPPSPAPKSVDAAVKLLEIDAKLRAIAANAAAPAFMPA